MSTFGQSRSSQQKSIGNYIILKTLGKGTFGKVKLAIHSPTQQYVAIKILEKSKMKNNNDIERVNRQIHILKKIRHPNIIQMYEIIETVKYIFLVMEYCPSGQLLTQIRYNQSISERSALRYFIQMVDAVSHLHKHGIIHRDLKPQNMLLDQNKNIKIIDYGLSNTYQKEQKLMTPCGSPCYACPQMISGKKYEPEKVDVWSLGVILYALLTGTLPFDEKNNDLLYYKIITLDYPIPSSMSIEAEALIRSIFTKESQRLTLQEIKNTKFYNKYPKQSLQNSHKNAVKNLLFDIPFNQRLFQLTTDQKNIDSLKLIVKSNKHDQNTANYYLSLKKSQRLGKMDYFELKQKQKASDYLENDEKNNTTKYSEFKIKQELSNLKKQASDPVQRQLGFKMSKILPSKSTVKHCQVISKSVQLKKEQMYFQKNSRYWEKSENFMKIQNQMEMECASINKISNQVKLLAHRKYRGKDVRQRLKINQNFRPMFKIKNYEFDSEEKRSQTRKNFQKNNTYLMYDKGLFSSFMRAKDKFALLNVENPEY